MCDTTEGTSRKPTTSDWNNFHSKVNEGDTEAVIEWFQIFNGPNIGLACPWTVNSPDPVCRAVETHNEIMLDFLLEHDFNPNRWISPTRGRSVNLKPIHIAAMDGRVNVLRKLIDCFKVSVDTPNSTNTTPLLMALVNFQCEAAKFLLSRNANVNYIHADQGLSPLVSAVGCGDVELLKEVVAAGADVNLNIGRWECALNRAVLMRRVDLVKVLCEGGARTDIRLSRGYTVLHIALTYPTDIQLIKYLININTSIYALTDTGHTPVHNGLCEASEENVRQWLSLMIAAGHQVTQRDYDVACERFSGDDGKFIQEQLEFHLNHPRTLKQLCCYAVRQILAGRFSQTVDCLPLPLICKKFIRLEQFM